MNHISSFFCRFPFLVFLFGFCFGYLSSNSMALAQYPFDELVRPYPKTIKEQPLVAKFDCNEAELPKWKALHQAALSANDSKFIRIESSGNDPYILLPEFDNNEAGTFRLLVQMRNTMRPDAEVFWTTEKNPNFNGENSVRFGFYQDQPENYVVDFVTDSPLKRLRFDPGTSPGIADIESIQLHRIVYAEKELPQTDWYNPNWAKSVTEWVTLTAGNNTVRFDKNGVGAQIFVSEKHVGDIYPLVHVNPKLPLGGVRKIRTFSSDMDKSISGRDTLNPVRSNVKSSTDKSVVFELLTDVGIKFLLEFDINESSVSFTQKSNTPVFGPVFRPTGVMEQALLCGVEYLERKEHSSATADIETDEHLRFAPNKQNITIPFMAIVTNQVGFGLLWRNVQETQPIFATPDFICGDSNSHVMSLFGNNLSGTLKILDSPSYEKEPQQLLPLEELILWAVNQVGFPELPERPRNDEQQRQLSLDGYNKSILFVPEMGWYHATMTDTTNLPFKPMFGTDFISAIWQLTGNIPETPKWVHGGGHLRNPVCFFVTDRVPELVNWCRAESQHIMKQQREDGSFEYNGIFLKGHWDKTASGYCGNFLYRLLYNHRILGDDDILAAAIKGLDFANKYRTPRGAQTWELSLHTPDIMGASRLCMANVWAFEATGEQKYLDSARRWAVTGLPFVYLWSDESIKARAEGITEVVMKYATTPVFGATQFKAPNWIGLPVQWCGLDYSEALFMLAKHDQTLDWKKIAEGILVTAEQMQYPSGPCVGLLPDSFVLNTQNRMPFDINPSVLIMQRQRLLGKPDSVCVATSSDAKNRVVSPFPVTLKMLDSAVNAGSSHDTNSKNCRAVIQGKKGTTYQILINGKEIQPINSEGEDCFDFHAK
ncbi:MAG: hypothetical protein ACRCUY_11965 [Thermoguttaceae bacterium]